MSKLEECILGDLVEFQRGYDLPKSKFVEGKYPVQSSNGILGYHNEYKVEGPGITIGRSGTVGNPHLIRENFFPHNTSLFVKEFKGNDIEYIYYLLQYLDLGNQKSGSGVPTMNRNHLHPIKIRAYRDKTCQQRTIKILSLIDKKIQINNQINQELESMAKTLYDYWFVQFDFPDHNGKPYKSSGGKMVYHPELKREIPEGWGVEKLGDVAYLKAGGDKPSNISEIQSKETPFPIYSNGLDNKGLYGYTNKATIHKKSLTVSARGTIGYIQRRFSSFFPIIRLISVTPKEEKMIGYIENFLKSIQFENSGSVQRQLTVPQIDKLYILVPKNEVLKKYHSMTINYYFEVENNEQQNQELIQLRDWLLPMLMNGQVKVE